MQLNLYVYALVGLAIGSFLNVCIYRIPLGKSVVFPRSHCPHCGDPIRLYDNLPVLSFLLLRGKCRSCGARISYQYPIVELSTCLAFLACALRWDFTSPTYVNSLLLSVVIVLIFVDYHHRILPNILTLPGAVAGMILSPFQWLDVYADPLSKMVASLLWHADLKLVLPWVGSILGAIIGGGPLLGVAAVYAGIRKKQGLGMGDVKMMAMVGAFLGWPLALLTIFAGSFGGSLVGIFLIIFRKQNLQTKLAFGVFLGLGTAFCLFYGLPILHWWLNMRR
jgi:leader peptidase (prepilin peptidase)/N-methyltransferase